MPCNGMTVEFDRNARALGEGTFGRVYRGRYAGNKVAVKEISHNAMARRISGSEARVKTKIEEILARECSFEKFDHPNLMRIFGHYMKETMDDKQTILVCEYCFAEHGSDLKQRLVSLGDGKRVGKLGEKEMLRLTLDMTAALEYLGQHGVAHRDVKPANILRSSNTSDRRVIHKLGDFGLGKDASVELLSTNVGTPKYRAPEVGETAEYGSEVDLWSLCVVLFEAATGKAPFGGDTVQKLVQSMRETMPESLARAILSDANENLGPGLALFVSRLLPGVLQYEPKKRMLLVDFIEQVHTLKHSPVRIFHVDTGKDIFLYLNRLQNSTDFLFAATNELEYACGITANDFWLLENVEDVNPVALKQQASSLVQSSSSACVHSLRPPTENVSAPQAFMISKISLDCRGLLEKLLAENSNFRHIGDDTSYEVVGQECYPYIGVCQLIYRVLTSQVEAFHCMLSKMNRWQCELEDIRNGIIYGALEIKALQSAFSEIARADLENFGSRSDTDTLQNLTMNLKYIEEQSSEVSKEVEETRAAKAEGSNTPLAWERLRKNTIKNLEPLEPSLRDLRRIVTSVKQRQDIQFAKSELKRAQGIYNDNAVNIIDARLSEVKKLAALLTEQLEREKKMSKALEKHRTDLREWKRMHDVTVKKIGDNEISAVKEEVETIKRQMEVAHHEARTALESSEGRRRDAEAAAVAAEERFAESHARMEVAHHEARTALESSESRRRNADAAAIAAEERAVEAEAKVVASEQRAMAFSAKNCELLKQAASTAAEAEGLTEHRDVVLAELRTAQVELDRVSALLTEREAELSSINDRKLVASQKRRDVIAAANQRETDIQERICVAEQKEKDIQERIFLLEQNEMEVEERIRESEKKAEVAGQLAIEAEARSFEADRTFRSTMAKNRAAAAQDMQAKNPEHEQTIQQVIQSLEGLREENLSQQIEVARLERELDYHQTCNDENETSELMALRAAIEASIDLSQSRISRGLNEPSTCILVNNTSGSWTVLGSNVQLHEDCHDHIEEKAVCEDGVATKWVRCDVLEWGWSSRGTVESVTCRLD